jgi:hypothetical protein
MTACGIGGCSTRGRHDRSTWGESGGARAWGWWRGYSAHRCILCVGCTQPILLGRFDPMRCLHRVRPHPRPQPTDAPCPPPLGSKPTARFQSMPSPPPIGAFEFVTATRWHPVPPPSLPPPLIPIEGSRSHQQTYCVAVSGCNLGRMPDPSIGTDDIGPSYDCIDDCQFLSTSVSASLDPPPL